MGLTNSSTVNNLFNNKLIYSDDIKDLLTKGIQFEKYSNKHIILELMNDVKNNHTYINRCNFILDYLSENFNIIVVK